MQLQLIVLKMSGGKKSVDGWDDDDWEKESDKGLSTESPSDWSPDELDKKEERQDEREEGKRTKKTNKTKRKKVSRKVFQKVMVMQKVQRTKERERKNGAENIKAAEGGRRKNQKTYVCNEPITYSKNGQTDSYTQTFYSHRCTAHEIFVHSNIYSPSSHEFFCAALNKS